MSLEEVINAYFVTTSSCAKNAEGENKNEKDFTKALNYLKNNIPEENIRQIKSSEGFPLIASGKLTKKDVFVFDRFEGDFFEQLQQTKSLIVGAPCLIRCLMNNEAIPLGTSPVYTTAMRDLQISATGIASQEKERLKTLIEWMGGHYFQNFGRSITHLVSNTIKSNKYEHATLNGIPVMHVDWVQRVWERSCNDDIIATDKEFEKYKLPIFFGVNITCTGIGTDQRNEIMRLVNDNGGTYQRDFRSHSVDIVITKKDKTDSEKYKAAVRYKKDILIPEWIFDSVQKGFALPPQKYKVKSLKVSTPTKDNQSIADFINSDNTQLSDLSRISAIGNKFVSNELSTVNDTISSALNDTQRFAVPAPIPTKELRKDVLKKSTITSHYRQIFEEINPKEAKKAGNFLDGCCVYLSGFHSEEREKLNRILNAGGATRYDAVNEELTHIIVGQLDDHEFNSWKANNLLAGVHIVRLEWLLESIKRKQPASEVIHRVSLPTAREPDAPSPSSKRTLRSMNHSFKQAQKPIRKILFLEENEKNESQISPLLTPLASSTEQVPSAEEQVLIAQYSQENIPAAVMPATNPPDLLNRSSSAGNSSTGGSLKERPPPSVALAVAAAPVQPNSVSLTDSTGMTIDTENLDFFKGMSLYIDKNNFPEEFYSQMLNECEGAHGNVVPSTFQDTVDYAIVPFEQTFDPKTLPVKAKHIVTELYVESCMKVNKLVPIEYYHKNIPVTANQQPLEGMIIVISVYTLLERDFIESVAQLMGGTVNKTFVKKERPLLICPSPEGSKYEGAIKWRYPVVTSSWLMDCAKEGKKLPFLEYLVGDSPEDFPSSPNLRGKPIDKPIRTPLANMELDANPNPNDLETPSASSGNRPNTIDAFTPLRNKRVSELAGTSHISRLSSGSSPESPHTPSNNYNRPSYNFDFMEKILSEIENEDERECLREVINDMKINQTPELERIRRQACTPINRKIPTPKGIPDFCTTPEFKKRMADEFERRWRLPTKKLKPDTPIEVIRKRVILATAKALGIPCGDENENEEQAESSRNCMTPITHLSTNSNTNTPLQRSNIPKGTGAPRSVFDQNATNLTTTNISINFNQVETRPSDTFVPNTQSPSGIGQRASLGGKSTINFDKISFEETSVGEDVTMSDKNQGAVSVGKSPEIKQITDYLRNWETRRQSLKRSRVSNDQQPTTLDGMMETEGHYVQPFESEQLATDDMVGWRDPGEFDGQRRSKVAETTMQFKGTPRFSISCSNEQIRDDVISKIMQLGGEICDNLVNFDPECTHFLCERPNRGEKFLGCISSGKWILSLKYIEECFAKDRFIDEELYEWGNCKALNLPQLTPEDQVIALAAHRWRKDLSSTLTNDRRGAFSGIRAILRISGRNIDALKNVIKAGKGEVIEVKSPYSQYAIVSSATHCFVDHKKFPLHREDYQFLKSCDIFVLSQMYINSFLMQGPDVDMSSFEIKM
uniref:BRCT domain-containing protein n=1 Tax=Glossina morsitans morsitans TaxID=37546 RepID=A0A1B0FH09_GLOMM